MINTKSHLVGVVDSESLAAAESDELNMTRIDFNSCDVLEIRYDLFKESQWQSLSARVKKIAPNAIQLGAIRLVDDGGHFPNNRANTRLDLWKKILEASSKPEWIDLEHEYLKDFHDLKDLINHEKIKILISQHYFHRAPNDIELSNYIDDVKRIHANGIKLAAISFTDNDCNRLYRFARKAKSFKFIAAFGMGKKGRVSRIWSLKEGANLTYGAIGKPTAPGQMNVTYMKKAIKMLDTASSQLEISSFLDTF